MAGLNKLPDAVDRMKTKKQKETIKKRREKLEREKEEKRGRKGELMKLDKEELVDLLLKAEKTASKMTLETYSIYSEGYRATGQSAKAKFHGTAEGYSFKDACINYAQRHPRFASYFDKDSMTYWGCKLYSNEHSARKSFG